MLSVGRLNNYSGSATGSDQVIAPTNGRRRILIIQNPSGNPMFINFGAAATADPLDGSLQLAPGGGNFVFETFQDFREIHLLGTASDKFVCREA